MNISENIGLGLGKVLSSITYVGSAIRDARIFHPEGDLIRCQVEVDAKDQVLERFARSLAGPALLRFSGGVWKDESSSFDILGCALRFGWNQERPLDERKVQDLVLGTFKSLVSLPFAPFTTKTHDYLDNIYYSVTPYKYESVGRVEFRLVGDPVGDDDSKNRADNLAKALRENSPKMQLQIKREGLLAKWEPLLSIRLEETVDLSDEKLFFSPFHTGKNIQPVGFVNFIRKKTYAASKAGRMH